MCFSRRWSRLLAGLAAIGLCLPASGALANHETGHSAKASTAVSPIRDVQLARGGLLVGRLLDANGQPRADRDVSIRASERCIAETRTDKNGVFAVGGLRGGVHQIDTIEEVQVCRLWVEGTAPPQADMTVEMVSGSDVVRGQWGPPPGNRFLKQAKSWGTNPFVVGGVVAAAVAIPIALSDDNGGPQS